jgi:hypothetical protein
MRFSKETFQVPASGLTGIRRFYRDASANLQRMGTADREARPAADALLADTLKARQTVLPLLEKDRDELKLRLEKAGVDQN